MDDGALGYSEGDLVKELKEWWDEEVIGDPFAAPAAPAGTIYELQPAVDSLGVVKQLVVIDKHVGFEVPPTVVKRGGYGTFEEMIADLLPKVRALYIAQQKKKTAA